MLRCLLVLFVQQVDYFPLAADAYIPAREASLKALYLDDNLAEAHASLGFVRYQYDWNWEGAEREFRRSIELSPGYATAHHWNEIYLASMGRCDEFTAEFRTAQLLDPLSMMIPTDLAAALFWCRQTDASIGQLASCA
jgi:tetratricopeptide (TPR) repeat protein